MIYVAIGGFFGAMTRFLVSQIIFHRLKKAKYFATFIVNCTGSFLLGYLFGQSMNEWLMQLFGIGFLGAFTTFSTFSFEVVQFMEQKRYQSALYYSCISVLLSIMFAMIGYMMS